MGFKTALYFVAASVPFFIFTVWAIVDALQKDFGTTGRKALWVLIAAVPFAGAPIYLLFGFRKGRKTASL
jgi:hypothetical protein